MRELARAFFMTGNHLMADRMTAIANAVEQDVATIRQAAGIRKERT